MQLKPRFRYSFMGSAKEAERRIASALNRPESTCKGRIQEGSMELLLNSDETHFWSPLLKAKITSEGETVSIVRGRFAPKSETWTMFLAIYAAIIFTTGIGVVFGFSQMFLGNWPWALWSLPIGSLLVGLVWLAASLGQRLSAHEMETLTTFVQEALTNT